jgi:uncharacterized hydrophobic protein (TIGR00271 family)
VSADEAPQDRAKDGPLSLAPIGRLGFRGRRATPEEQAQILDGYFHEGGRRVPYLQQFFVLMLLSAAIAGFGLANDSAAVVIGAMLVAPLMTPILAIAASIVQGWPRRMAESLAIVGGGALAAIGVGFLIGQVAMNLQTGLPLPGEILARTNPNLVDLGIAITAGAAGGFVAVRTDAGGALPGVGIAVALVPPLATVGMTAALGDWSLAAGATLLFLTNLVAIVLAAGLVFTAAGFGAYRDEAGRQGARVASIIVVVGVFLVGIPLLVHSLQRVDQDNAIATAAREVRAWAPDLKLNDVTIDHSADPVVVTVLVTGTEAPPGVDMLAGRLADDFDRAVDVDLVFVPLVSGSAPAP